MGIKKLTEYANEFISEEIDLSIYDESIYEAIADKAAKLDKLKKDLQTVKDKQRMYARRLNAGWVQDSAVTDAKQKQFVTKIELIKAKIKELESVKESANATVGNTNGVGSIVIPGTDGTEGSGDKLDKDKKQKVEEMSQTDIHFKNIVDYYKGATDAGKHRVSLIIAHKKMIDLSKLEKELLDMDYDEIITVEKELGIADKIK